MYFWWSFGRIGAIAEESLWWDAYYVRSAAHKVPDLSIYCIVYFQFQIVIVVVLYSLLDAHALVTPGFGDLNFFS